MRSATEMPDQSSSGGVSPARNTLLVMTRRPPNSDVITSVYHNIRSWATARSGASAVYRKVARRQPTEAAFRGNSRAGAAERRDHRASPSHTLCPRRRIRSVEFACSGGCNGNNVPSRRGGAPRCAPIPSRCARMRPRVVQRGRGRSRSPCAACLSELGLDIPTSGLDVQVALGCLPNDWCSAARPRRSSATEGLVSCNIRVGQHSPACSPSFLQVLQQACGWDFHAPRNRSHKREFMRRPQH